jgi:pimeloyl-ACP methyl ester carboxylesterase
MLYVEESGPGTAPTILFLHGGGLSSRMWKPQIERLSDNHCLAPDLPEQGRSASVKPFVLDDAARQVASIIRERAHGQRAHVVGLSLGGTLTLELLRIAPECVDHAMISGASAGVGKVLAAIGISSAWLYRFIGKQTLLKAAYKQFAIPEQYRDLVRDDLLQSFTPAFTRATMQASRDVQIPRKLTAPVLIAVGEKETVVAKQHARKLVGAIEGARGVMVPGLGHVWNLQAPDLFAETVRAWIADSPLPEALKPL